MTIHAKITIPTSAHVVFSLAALMCHLLAVSWLFFSAKINTRECVCVLHIKKRIKGASVKSTCEMSDITTWLWRTGWSIWSLKWCQQCSFHSWMLWVTVPQEVQWILCWSKGRWFSLSWGLNLSPLLSSRLYVCVLRQHNEPGFTHDVCGGGGYERVNVVQSAPSGR